MSNSIEDRSIIVTGSGRGIGRSIAEGLAQAGARVVIADINAETAEATAAEIREAGGRAIGLAVDVTDRASTQALIARTVSSYGRLDAIFNNAGIAQVKQFNDITEDDWHRVMDVNAMGVLIGIQEASKQFIAQGGGGKIINTASIAGKQGYEPLAHYSASKFAVVALTQAAARAFGKHRINVNAICPGVVATDMWKLIDKGFKDEGLTSRDNEAFEGFSAGILLGRPSHPEDLAGVSIFLASAGSDYMTGQSLVVDGGMVLV
ncbi:glucose 1-dehydrogenase [Sinirhodobacter populi]|uniref:Glucose 1-dehydrogenase n=1 Tax=Paenirhodobacter populi TaxID=2306993 RepID=A0A443K7H2_9RHOB|nr:glucose 1-dehydrogenase [Sinirhodobacter populi]RWR09247.1 glucose 1-dehydrogenase [Sinirhodobacter populi]RWR28741.1 glucose 1-dehydrogenase [Sinirhodobacter populi]